jgi:bacillithiol biosynthesis deacetylase BshB1
MKLHILAIGAHPDDVELGCAGTLITQVQLGHQVGILDLTRGETGTRGTPEIRDEEGRAAAAIIGAVVRENLGLPDGFIDQSREQKMALIRILRKYRPDVVIGNAMDDRHPDHGNAATLIEEACFLSGLAKIQTELDGAAQVHWRPRMVLHYIQDRFIQPDVVMDITAVMDQKMESILAHRSQFYDPSSSEPETYIASKGFLDNIPARAMEHGRPCGFAYGEAFTCKRYIGVNNILHLY